MTDLKQYGLDESFISQAANYKDMYLARIISLDKGIYQAVCANGELYAQVAGKLRFEADSPSDYPAVGDFVMLDRDAGENGNAIIRRVLKRKSLFKRKAAGKTSEEQVVAANIDIVFICMSLNKDFNVHRLERYLSLAWESGATPVVVLTKSDVCDDLAAKLESVYCVALGVDVVVTTSMEASGWRDVCRYITPGRTVALLGSSGVGKSTLINRLLGREALDTSDIGFGDKGRHTTTRRQLLLLPAGGVVIDTPGMREMGMRDVSSGLDRSFSDVEAFLGKCRFGDCTHTSEPGCAILNAIENGELSRERWESYSALKAEAQYADDKASFLAEKEQKFKNIAKMNKANKNR